MEPTPELNLTESAQTIIIEFNEPYPKLALKQSVTIDGVEFLVSSMTAGNTTVTIVFQRK